MGLASAGLVSMGLATAAPMGMGFLKFPKQEMPGMEMHSSVEQDQGNLLDLVQREQAGPVPTESLPEKQESILAQSALFPNSLFARFTQASSS